MADNSHNFEEISGQGFLARIVGFEGERSTMFIRLLNGMVQTLSTPGHELWGVVGDVIFVADNSYRVVPGDMWLEDTMVGVVRLKHNDVIVLDLGNRIVTVPASGIVAYVNNTVEATASQGIIRILSDDSLPPLDRTAASDEVLIRVKQTDFGDADTLDSIGGLRDVVREARRLVLLPMEEPERFERLGGSPIKGVLFTGPPGVGKTMLARALAHEAGAAFYNIRGPELSSMWVGESERVLRRYLFSGVHPVEHVVV